MDFREDLRCGRVYNARRGDGDIGKYVVLNLDETGEEIGKQLFSLLTEKQRKELAQFTTENNSPLYMKIQRNTLLNDITVSEDWKQILTERQIDDLYFCLEKREVCVRGQAVRLTVKEFDIFALLIMHPKRVFTYEMLMDIVWHEDYMFYSRKAINNHVSNLRKKLKIASDIPDYVKSVYGVGYKFEV